MDQELFKQVQAVIAETLNVDSALIKPDSKFQDDLGADSLALMELVMAFEEKFQISIPDEDLEKIRTVEDVVNYIAGHLKDKKGGGA